MIGPFVEKTTCIPGESKSTITSANLAATVADSQGVFAVRKKRSKQ